MLHFQLNSLSTNFGQLSFFCGIIPGLGTTNHFSQDLLWFRFAFAAPFRSATTYFPCQDLRLIDLHCNMLIAKNREKVIKIVLLRRQAKKLISNSWALKSTNQFLFSVKYVQLEFQGEFGQHFTWLLHQGGRREVGIGVRRPLELDTKCPET